MAIDRPRPEGRATYPRAAVPAGPLMLLALLLGAPVPVGAALKAGDDYETMSLEQLDRAVALIRPDQGEQGDHRRRWLTWRVEYRLRNAGRMPLLVEPETIFCTVEGWASNSRSDGHGLPRRADHALSTGDELESIALLIDHDEPTRACRERATLEVWPEDGPAPAEPAVGASCEAPAEPFRLEPGAVLRARIRLEHRHHLHGPTEPLLGDREVNLRVGPASFRDVVALDRPIPPNRPIDRLGPIPDDRRDPRIYYSPPDSLYLDAALAGFRSYQFRDLKVPRDAAMRLSFRYFRSTDSVGQARAELKQYRDVPNSYRALIEAKRVEELDRPGEWVLVEHRFRSEPTATTMQLKFLIDCEGAGPAALWIDDVALEPVEGSAELP